MPDENAELLDALATIEKLCLLMGEREDEFKALIEENKRLKAQLEGASGKQIAQAPPAAPATPAKSMDPAKCKILLVDDSRMDQRMTTGLLESVGLTDITHAQAGKEALVLIQAARFNVVLLDYEMSDGNGVWFLTSCRELGIRVPVIMLSGTLDKQIVRDCLRAGAVDFLVKPIQKELLVSRVEKALNFRFAR